MSVAVSEVQVALKEWAVTAKVLSQGKQILILRKGGIHQEDKNFRIIHPNFLILETYEHQKPELVKPEFSDMCQSLIDSSPLDRGVVLFNLWAKVTDKFELRDEQDLLKINDKHLWTDDYAKSRFHWRPSQPLTIALLRVYKLREPIEVPVSSEFAGCKSWIEFNKPVVLGEMTPVLDESEYAKISENVKEILSASLV